MKLQIANDVHLEFYYSAPQKVVRTIERIPLLADTLMLAGDVHTPHRFYTNLVFETFCKRWKKVFYVPGNHDYWTVKKTTKKKQIIWEPEVPRKAGDLFEWFVALEQKFPNLTVLRNDLVVEHEGKRFLGDTMWFPDLPLNFPFKNEMFDFEKIGAFEPWVYERHVGFRAFLQRELREGDVVMTHHLPTYASISELWRQDTCNPFYAAEMSDLFVDRKPVVWIHGHNHVYEDQKFADTRVLSNPKGYPSKLMRTFDEGMVVEV